MNRKYLKKNIVIPNGNFCRECCANCRHGEEDSTANWKVYCNRKRTHVRPEDRCGYYE